MTETERSLLRADCYAVGLTEFISSLDSFKDHPRSLQTYFISHVIANLRYEIDLNSYIETKYGISVKLKLFDVYLIYHRPSPTVKDKLLFYANKKSRRLWAFEWDSHLSLMITKFSF